MRRQIRVLPPEVISHIAAGEVVERPASVIKELIENALDAESTEIFVRAAGGGVSMLEVSDNGLGMDPKGAAEAFERYATSKIRTSDDLMRLGTLGFRGEALYSIASVSRCELITRERVAQEGTRIVVEGGMSVENSTWGAPPGTRVRVEDLFFNLPARRKFLRSQRTEAGHVRGAVEKIAMMYPQVGFRYEYEDRTILECPPSSSWRERVRQLWGKDAVKQLFWIREERRRWALEGFLSHPNFHRSASSWLWIYVNGRIVQERGALHALVRGYGSLLERGRYPVGVISIAMDPEDVDVNVHPTKKEVRFRDVQSLQDTVVAAVRRLLREQPWVSEILDLSDPPTGDVHSSVSSQIAAPQPVLAFRSDPYHAPTPAHDQVSEEGGETSPRGALFLGQVHGIYLVFSVPDGLLLVDQHAAHERILFEELKAQLGKDRPPAQTLMWEEIVELGSVQSENLDRLRDMLARLGWRIEPFGGETWRIRSVPAWLDPASAFGLLSEILEECDENGMMHGWEPFVDRILARMACHGAVRGSHWMGATEALELLRKMHRTASTGLCPHGRPTLVKVSLSELKRRFGRN